MVYFVEGEDTGLFKIGVTDDIDERMRVLSSGSPVPLVLRAKIDGANESVEHDLHKFFREYAHHGEWFLLPKNWEEKLLSRYTLEHVVLLKHSIGFRSACKCIKLGKPSEERAFIPSGSVISDEQLRQDIERHKNYESFWEKFNCQIESQIAH
jgi:hypothetical protein